MVIKYYKCCIMGWGIFQFSSTDVLKAIGLEMLKLCWISRQKILILIIFGSFLSNQAIFTFFKKFVLVSLNITMLKKIIIIIIIMIIKGSQNFDVEMNERKNIYISEEEEKIAKQSQ